MGSVSRGSLSRGIRGSVQRSAKIDAVAVCCFEFSSLF